MTARSLVLLRSVVLDREGERVGVRLRERERERVSTHETKKVLSKSTKGTLLFKSADVVQFGYHTRIFRHFKVQSCRCSKRALGILLVCFIGLKGVVL